MHIKLSKDKRSYCIVKLSMQKGMHTWGNEGLAVSAGVRDSTRRSLEDP
jgi:hypothetical protein